MRLTLRLSPSLTSAGDPRFRFRFLLFDVRMWRRCERPRFTFPVPVNLKRLAAPLCVFSFGIKSPRETAVSSQPSAVNFKIFAQLSELPLRQPRSYDAGLATCAGGALGLGALCAAAFSA